MEWIDIKKEKPNDGEEVFVCYKDYGEEQNQYDIDRFIGDKDDFCNYDYGCVTHWMRIKPSSID